MSIKNRIDDYPIAQLGASHGNYLHFDEGTKVWTVIQLNFLAQLIRWLGLSYHSTRIDFIARNIFQSDEFKHNGELLLKICNSWKKAFPLAFCPYEKLLGSQLSTRKKLPQTFKVGATSIAAESGRLVESKVDCILIPAIRKPFFILSAELGELYEDLGEVLGHNILELTRISCKTTPESADSLPPLIKIKNLESLGMKKILLPKLPPSEVVFTPTLAGIEHYAQFLIRCLNLAKNEGVRSFAFSPHSFAPRGNIEWAKIDFEVIEKFVLANPRAFDTIKLRYVD